MGSIWAPGAIQYGPQVTNPYWYCVVCLKMAHFGCNMGWLCWNHLGPMCCQCDGAKVEKGLASNIEMILALGGFHMAVPHWYRWWQHGLLLLIPSWAKVLPKWWSKGRKSTGKSNWNHLGTRWLPYAEYSNTTLDVTYLVLIQILKLNTWQFFDRLLWISYPWGFRATITHKEVNKNKYLFSNYLIGNTKNYYST